MADVAAGGRDAVLAAAGLHGVKRQRIEALLTPAPAPFTAGDVVAVWAVELVERAVVGYDEQAIAVAHAATHLREYATPDEVRRKRPVLAVVDRRYVAVAREGGEAAMLDVTTGRTLETGEVRRMFAAYGELIVYNLATVFASRLEGYAREVADAGQTAQVSETAKGG